MPHASTVIPADVRTELLIADDDLDAELKRMTDWYTDDLFAWLTDHGATLFVNRLSRFVFDPERFIDDDRESTAAMGQGVVYTRTTDGRPLRHPTRVFGRVVSRSSTGPTTPHSTWW